LSIRCFLSRGMCSIDPMCPSWSSVMMKRMFGCFARVKLARAAHADSLSRLTLILCINWMTSVAWSQLRCSEVFRALWIKLSRLELIRSHKPHFHNLKPVSQHQRSLSQKLNKIDEVRWRNRIRIAGNR
jgi:hypothetical protein